MTEEQFETLVDLLTDIKDSIDNLITSETSNQKKLDDIKNSVQTIKRSIKD